MRQIHSDNNGMAVTTVDTGDKRAGRYYEVLAGCRSYEISFQNGPVAARGINGMTSEALLAILKDRTLILNEAYPCHENDEALFHICAALEAFELRTSRRRSRGVEGQAVL